MTPLLRIAAIGVAFASIGTAEQADASQTLMYSCVPQETRTGARERLTSVDVSVSDLRPEGRWSVVYHAANGAAYDRTKQYDLVGNIGPGRYWTGRLKTNPNLEMVGSLQNRVDGVWYIEKIFDKSNRDRNVATIVSRCEPPTIVSWSDQPPAPAQNEPPMGTVGSHDDMVIFDAKNAREMARDAEKTHLEHPEVFYIPYQADSRLTEKTEELQPFFDDWQYEYISAACKLGRWKDKDVSNLDWESDPFDKAFFSNLHKLFRDGRDEFVAMRHLPRVFYAEHPELPRAYNDDHETESSNCSGTSGVGGVTVCVTTDICSVVERSPGFQKIKTLFGDWPPPPTPIRPRASHSAASSESKCSPISDMKQQIVCYENALQDIQLSERLQPDVTDPNSVIHGSCIDSYFPIGFPIDYSACNQVAGHAEDNTFNPIFLVAKSGAFVVTSGEHANEIFDQNGTHIANGNILFFAKGPPVDVDGIYVQAINSTAIELPKFDSQFADKLAANGSYGKWFINSEGNCAWREPFAQTKFVICDVNSSVGSFHIVFKRGPFQQD